jgi:hypothetical protein
MGACFLILAGILTQRLGVLGRSLFDAPLPLGLLAVTRPVASFDRIIGVAFVPEARVRSEAKETVLSFVAMVERISVSREPQHDQQNFLVVLEGLEFPEVLRGNTYIVFAARETTRTWRDVLNLVWVLGSELPEVAFPLSYFLELLIQEVPQSVLLNFGRVFARDVKWRQYNVCPLFKSRSFPDVLECEVYVNGGISGETSETRGTITNQVWPLVYLEDSLGFNEGALASFRAFFGSVSGFFGGTALPPCQSGVDGDDCQRRHLDNKLLFFAAIVFLALGLVLLYRTLWNVCFNLSPDSNAAIYVSLVLISATLTLIGMALIVVRFGLIGHMCLPSSGVTSM